MANKHKSKAYKKQTISRFARFHSNTVGSSESGFSWSNGIGRKFLMGGRPYMRAATGQVLRLDKALTTGSGKSKKPVWQGGRVVANCSVVVNGHERLVASIRDNGPRDKQRADRIRACHCAKHPNSKSKGALWP